jgi:alkaline phosphatase
VCAYDAAWAVALEFADMHPDVLVVGSSDHDTGGLSVGCCDRYAMDGDALRRQKFSAEYVAYAVIDAYGAAWTNGEDIDAQGPAILAAAFAAAGRDVDAAESRITAEALAALHDLAKAASDPAKGAGARGTHGYEGWALQNAVGEALSAASSVGWTSHGHTGVDVAVFARGPGAEAFRGYSRNDEVGRAVIDALGVDPAAGLEAFEQRMALKSRRAADEPPSPPPG